MAKTKGKSSESSRHKGGSNKIVCKDGTVKKKIPKLHCFTLFKCDQCNKEFTDKWNLYSHKKLHTTETPFKCPQCPYRGKTKKYVSRHMKRHKKLTDEHQCKICGKRFLYECNLKVHTMVHTGEKPHECKVCGKTFRVTYSLNSHMLIHKDVKPFECSFCEYACRDSSTLRKHQNKHMGIEHKYECKICNKKYKSLAALKIHISETHLEIDMHRFPCERCGKTFKTKAHMRFHITSIHERALVCECPVCGRRIANKHNLPSHMRSHIDERPFSCTHPGCCIAFKDKGSLMKHKAIHDPALRVACRHCGRSFARPSHRNSHERVMHRERKRAVQCDYCGSRFYSKNYLTKHIQTKHVLRHKFKYICDVCGLTTHNKPSIVMHLKYGHLNDNDVTCNICSVKFCKHLHLKAHYWRTHNIRYKVTRKAANNKKDEKPMVEIKVEPIEAESYEDMKFLDVIKQEEAVDDESLDYSKRVLCEDLALSLRCKPPAAEVEFDDFLVRHVLAKQEREAEPVIEGVNEEKREFVKKRIKQILITTQKMEKAKKRKQDKQLRREKETAEAAAREERKRREIFELKRVRDTYNERMRAFAKKKDKKKQVTIKYFKKKPDESSKPVNEVDDSKNDSNDDVESDDNLPLNILTDCSKANDGMNTSAKENNEIDVSHRNELNANANNVDSSLSVNADKNDEIAFITQHDKGVKTNELVDKNNESDTEYNDSTPNNEKRLTDNENNETPVVDTKSNNEKYATNTKTDVSVEENDITTNNNNTVNLTNDLSIDNNDSEDYGDIFNQPLKKRLRKKNKSNKVDKVLSENDNFSNDGVTDDESWKDSDEERNDSGKARRIEFKTHQCYICFKLFQTKPELITHCQEHFDVCNERTLTKCPMCNHVSYKSLAKHMKKTHNVTFKIPVSKLKDRKNEKGSRYCYDVNGTIIEVIPSVKTLNKQASIEIDRRKRETIDKSISKTKLVKKGDGWIVEKEAIEVKFDEIPEFDDRDLAKCKVSDNDVDRLGQLNYLAKKKGLKIMFPCFDCDKVCQGFSALKLHKRRHEVNPKPFRPREKKPRFEPRIKEKKKNIDKSNRTALPKPIVNNHKCDAKLKEFYESNIRGSDIEFWQFLKIFNKMDRENVNDFKDLESRTDFGIHCKVGNDETEIENDETKNDVKAANDDEMDSDGTVDLDDEIEDIDDKIEDIDDEVEDIDDKVENVDDKIEDVDDEITDINNKSED